MDYLEKLKMELTMSHANNGWYNEWVKQKIEQIKKIKEDGKSKKNS
jgi:hypothetical protein